MFIWIIFGLIAFASYAIQANLKTKFEKFSKIRLQAGMTGAEVASKMLRDNGLSDVRVISVAGRLTDHYNPADKTVNLSEAVYGACSVAAAAVAAHECGHAVQHAKAYAPLRMRSALVPVVSFSARWVQWILLAGILMVNVFPGLLLIGILLFAFSTLFSFITLPVEIDASMRAVRWLRESGIAVPQEYPYAVSALKSAAYTYVAAALGSLATLVYYALVFLNSSSRR